MFTVPVEFVACPRCQAPITPLSHVLVHADKTYRCQCEKCGAGVVFTHDGNEIKSGIADTRRHVEIRILFCSQLTNPAGEHIWIFVPHMTPVTKEENVIYNSTFEAISRYYNEHTCPTNWLRSADAIVTDTGGYIDSDPHGVFVVAGIWLQDDYDAAEEALKDHPGDNLDMEATVVDFVRHKLRGKIINDELTPVRSLPTILDGEKITLAIEADEEKHG